MFESSVGHVTDQESRLFSKFHKASEKSTQWLKRYRRGASRSQHELSDDILNIHQETRLLAETKDIQDELNIIDMVLDSQRLVLKEFQKNITDELRVEGSRKTTDGVIKEIRQRFQEQERLLEVHQNDLDRIGRTGTRYLQQPDESAGSEAEAFGRPGSTIRSGAGDHSRETRYVLPRVISYRS
jgi:hypothetical protein